jgi:hypothetical protein
MFSLQVIFPSLEFEAYTDTAGRAKEDKYTHDSMPLDELPLSDTHTHTNLFDKSSWNYLPCEFTANT